MADKKYEDKPGDGVLFKVQDKKHEKAPDFTGRLTAHRDMKEGEEYEIAGWAREGKNGGKFLSLKTQDKRGDNGKPARRDDREDVF